MRRSAGCLDEVDKLGLRENTIIILWGDHGWKLGEHASLGQAHERGKRHTRALDNRSARHGHRRQTQPALVEFVDIYPTLAELAGLTASSSPRGLEP